jgi:hypothetical protein
MPCELCSYRFMPLHDYIGMEPSAVFRCSLSFAAAVYSSKCLHVDVELEAAAFCAITFCRSTVIKLSAIMICIVQYNPHLLPICKTAA